MAVLSILDRDDICDIYQLVMNRYQDEIPEGFDKILWGDLMIMFNQSDNDEFWNAQQSWKIVSWKLHSSSGDQTVPEFDCQSIYKLLVKTWSKSVDSVIVDSLLKTIRLSIHLVVYNKDLAIPEQRATGKGISNPLMAGSLPKTTKPTQLDVDVTEKICC
ncbi:hypothetical protein Tco_1223715 [Tanacetum coccineum]